MKISRSEYSIKTPFYCDMSIEEINRYKKWIAGTDYFNNMVLVDVPWEKADLDALFNGPYACCASELSDKRRLKENFVAMHSLIIDFDNKVEGSTATVKSIVGRLGSNISYYINNSISSSKQHIKLHLCIPVNRPIKHYELDYVRSWVRTTFSGLMPDDSVIIEDCKGILHGRDDMETWFHSGVELNVDDIIYDIRLTGIRNAPNEILEDKKTKTKKIVLVEQDIRLADNTIVSLEEAVELHKVTGKSVRCYCPLCNHDVDRAGHADNAFLNVNPHGLPFIHCMSKKETYWFKPEHVYKFLLDKYYFRGTQLYELLLEDGCVQDCQRTTDMLPFDNAGQREGARRYIADKQTVINLREFRKSDPMAVESYCKWRGNYRDVHIPVCVHDSVKDNEAVEAYLGMLFGDGDDFVFIREYITCLMYHNGSPKLPSIFLLGARRTGKTMFGQALVDLLGEHLAASVDTVGGRFNVALEKKFLLMNEAKEADRVDAKDISNLLKNITGDKMLSIEKKGVDKYNVINNCNLMYTTNRRRVLYLPEGDIIHNVRINPYFMRMFEEGDRISGDAERTALAKRGSTALAHWVKTVGWTLWNDKLRDQCKVGSGWDYCIDTPVNEALIIQEGMSVSSRQRYAIEYLMHQIEYEKIILEVGAYMDFTKRDLREKIKDYHRISSAEAMSAVNWMLEHPHLIKEVKPHNTKMWRVFADEVVKYS